MFLITTWKRRLGNTNSTVFIRVLRGQKICTFNNIIESTYIGIFLFWGNHFWKLTTPGVHYWNTLFFRGSEFDTRSQESRRLWHSKETDFYILFYEFIFRCFHLNVFISRDQHLKPFLLNQQGRNLCCIYTVVKSALKFYRLKLCYKCMLLLPVEFMTSEIENHYWDYRFQDYYRAISCNLNSRYPPFQESKAVYTVTKFLPVIGL